MILYDAVKAALPDADIRQNAPMAQLTTMRVGGPADCLINVSDEQEITVAADTAHRLGKPLTVIGNGSNLIVRDGGIRGLVIRVAERMGGAHIVDGGVRARAGITLAALARFCANHGLAGMEFASGIPGTLGGALCMNAGAYGGQMSAVTRRVSVTDANGCIMRLENGACMFGYRTSAIKTHGYIALEADLMLGQGDKDAIYARMEELAQRRRLKQPLSLPSAGSVFKRPEGDFAGRLIEEAGLKGARIGGAMVSDMHANFIVNTGGASAGDVIGLMALVRERVQAHAGILLESELCVIGSEGDV